MHMTKVFFHKN